MKKTLVLRCSDGRNALGLMFYTLDFAGLKLMEAPQIASTIPGNINLLVTEHDVGQILVVVHTTFPKLTGCGGLDTRAKMRGGFQLSNAGLAHWLHNSVKGENPLDQARKLGERLAPQINPSVEIAVCLFDHVSQLLYLVGSRRPAQHWTWLSQTEWQEALQNGHIARLSWGEAGQVVNRLLQENMAYNDYASEGAERRNFRVDQSFEDLVLNGTAYPPESFAQVAMAMGIENEPRPDAYFSVYANPASPTDAVTQLEYALEHAIEKCKEQLEGCEVNIWVLAHSSIELVVMVNALERSALYSQLKSYPNWHGRIYQAVVDKPY